MKEKLLLLMLLFIAASCKKTIDRLEQLSKPATQKTETNYYRLPPGAQPTTIQFQNGKTLSLYVADSSYYLECDMVLTKTQIEKLRQINSGNQRTYITPFVNHWWGGWVPYVINVNFSAGARTTILNAIADWQNNTTLNFVERTAQNAYAYPDYVEFTPSTVNNSYIGRIGGKQIINLAVAAGGGVDLTSTTHEIGHSIGFYHEQSRTDRNNFIVVNWGNIRNSAAHNFETYAALGQPGGQIGAFDFTSIMLYPSFIFDPNFTIDPFIPALIRLDGSVWGTNFVLSAGDIETANFIYGPPYAKIEYLRVADNSWWTWSTDYEYYEDDVFVRLYADENCTIPFTTPVDKSVDLLYKENINGSTWSGPVGAVVPAGSNQVLIQQNLNTRLYYAEFGTPVNWEQRWYERQSAFFRN